MEGGTCQLGARLIPVDSLRRPLAPGESYRTVYYFSRPGYSPDRRRAIVRVDLGCGPMCSSGSLLLLERAAAGWRIARHLEDWKT